jgi:initiation factor 1A
MPKKSKGANNTRRMAPKRLPIEYADNKYDQLYGTVDSVLGECHFNVVTINKDIKRCSLKGTIKRCGRIRVGDTVLIEPFNGTEYRIVFRYTPDQRKTLEKEGHINASLDAEKALLLDSNESEDEDGFAFADDNQGTQHQQDEALRRAADMKLLEGMIDDIKK